MAVKKIKFNQGLGMLEVLMAISLLTLLFIYLLSVLNLALKTSSQQRLESKAYGLLQESVEGLRNFRDGTDWNVNGIATFTLGAAYHLEKTGTPLKWQVVSDVSTVDGFSQSIVFNAVQRDVGSSSIVESGGVIDTNSIKAVVKINWQEGSKTRELQSIVLLTDWQ